MDPTKQKAKMNEKERKNEQPKMGQQSRKTKKWSTIIFLLQRTWRSVKRKKNRAHRIIEIR